MLTETGGAVIIPQRRTRTTMGVFYFGPTKSNACLSERSLCFWLAAAAGQLQVNLSVGGSVAARNVKLHPPFVTVP